MQDQEIIIKGIRQGLLIQLGAGEWEDQFARLRQRLRLGANFFHGGRAALDVGDRRLTEQEIVAAQDLLSQHEIELWAVLSRQDETLVAAARLGLAVNLGVTEELVEEVRAEAEGAGLSTVVAERTLRSGQRIHHPGHVIVFGDVNAGAEVVAGGHIVVWGKVRGLVHAGAFGDEGARICALELEPTQLRIAEHIARPPEGEGRSRPEMAQVRQGRIEAVPWRLPDER
jgi:septum site-determining protein MinC